MERKGFIKVKDGKQYIDEEAIKKFVEENYPGWYKPDPLVRWKTLADGKTIEIKYGKEKRITDWQCC